MGIRNNFASKKQFMAAQLAILTGLLLAIPARRYPQFHPDLMDGVRGLLFGIAFGLLALAAFKNRRR